jgi:hypothetical protein
MNAHDLTADIEERSEAGVLNVPRAKDRVDIEYLAFQISDEERRKLLTLLVQLDGGGK